MTDLTFDYTHKNHFWFGYRREDLSTIGYCDPKGTDTYKWDISFGQCEYIPTSFRDECDRAARLISESTDEIPNIMFSGGMESEIVIRSFERQHLPFRVSILRFKKNLNIHDICFAVTYCESRSIPYDIIDLNIETFMEEQVYEYAERTKSCSPQLPPTMWLADQIDGLPILGSGEPYVYKQVPEDYISGESPYESSDWFFSEKERIQAWYRHFIQQNRPAIPGFFQYTPELMYSFLSHSIIKLLVNDEYHGKLSAVTSKNNIYKSWYDDLWNRTKHTGFEKLSELDETVRENLLDLYGNYNRMASIEYHTFMSKLMKED
jgi:hypothetical protein